MKEQHIKALAKVLAVIALILLLRYSYLWIKRQFQALESHAIEPTATVATKQINAATYSGNNSFPLKQGSKGSNVIKLQQFLNAYAGASLTVDGKFGPKTKAALAAYNGQTSVSQASLTNWINSKIKNTTDSTGSWGQPSANTNTTDTGGAPDYFSDDTAQYPQNLTDYAAELKTDLDETKVFTTRNNSGVYAQALLLSPADLKKVSDIFTNVYGESLYNRVDNARFYVGDNVDILIMNKLIACGAGPK